MDMIIGVELNSGSDLIRGGGCFGRINSLVCRHWTATCITTNNTKRKRPVLLPTLPRERPLLPSNTATIFHRDRGTTCNLQERFLYCNLRILVYLVIYDSG